MRKKKTRKERKRSAKSLFVDFFKQKYGADLFLIRCQRSETRLKIKDLFQKLSFKNANSAKSYPSFNSHILKITHFYIKISQRIEMDVFLRFKERKYVI